MDIYSEWEGVEKAERDIDETKGDDDWAYAVPVFELFKRVSYLPKE